MTQPIRVAITGAGGQIGYSLLFRVASGEVFGPKQPVILHLLELPQAIKATEGTAMELEDCAFPTLAGINISDDAKKAFEGINLALLVGSKPRGPGMERNDLIKENGPVFVAQGKALARAAQDVKVVVVGNPCNTNCLIAQKNCPELPASRFTAMTMLDENRAKWQLSAKAKVPVGKISNLCVFGNHSSSMVPDFENAMIDGRSVTETIHDRAWLEGEFFSVVQKRGAAIISARGKSSAASAASACIDHVKQFLTKTPIGEWFSAAIPSDSNPYGIPAGLIFSFPVRSHGNGSYEIVPGLKHGAFLKEKIALTTKELQEERDVVKDLLG